MIELHISPGYNWDVLETKGDLQPDIESLDIPHEFMAKFESWQKKWHSDLWKPDFIGRKEYEGEGRAIAEELQQAVGNRFHIVFRHWVAFDPKQWRTQWREVNLITRDEKEFWIGEDLPDDLTTQVVRIYPDSLGAYLWDLDGCCIGNTGPVFSDDLDARFMSWSDSWDACCDDETFEVDKAKLAAEKLEEKGLALALELKRAIGNAAKVIYCCHLSRPALEVFEDGTLKEWPHGTDFRQWALDQRDA